MVAPRSKAWDWPGQNAQRRPPLRESGRTPPRRQGPQRCTGPAPALQSGRNFPAPLHVRSPAMRPLLLLLASLLGMLAALVPPAPPPADEPANKPPSQRQLQGEDARRAGELERQFEEL